MYIGLILMVCGLLDLVDGCIVDFGVVFFVGCCDGV